MWRWILSLKDAVPIMCKREDRVIADHWLWEMGNWSLGVQCDDKADIHTLDIHSKCGEGLRMTWMGTRTLVEDSIRFCRKRCF
jgi:hypothetical protein